jgi:hypothetical protein
MDTKAAITLRVMKSAMTDHHAQRDDYDAC